MVIQAVVTVDGDETCEVSFTECVVEFSFRPSDPTHITIENARDYSCPASTLPWIIAGSLVGAILLLGLLALVILKICLVFLVNLLILHAAS